MPLLRTPNIRGEGIARSRSLSSTKTLKSECCVAVLEAGGDNHAGGDGDGDGDDDDADDDDDVVGGFLSESYL